MIVAAAPRPAPPSRAPEPEPASESPGLDVLPARLLLVEPEPEDARLLGAALVRAGFGLEIAGTLAEARRRVRQRSFDLVLAAAALPDGSPLDLLDRHAVFPSLPIVLLLDSVSADTVRDAFAAGVLEFFVKDGALLPLLPLRVERLLQLVSERRILSDLFEENARLLQANNLLREATTRDPLTGILDERGFAEAVRCEAARSERTGAPLAVACFDLDFFQRLNESQGREAGDAVLQSVGALLRHEARAGDLLGRFDGDGFAVLLPGSPLSGALRFAERVREKVEGFRIPWKDAPLGTTLSGGAGLVAQAPETPAELVGWARERLRELKSGGRNRVGVFA